jgi:Flp pilus assembly pilin Flp
MLARLLGDDKGSNALEYGFIVGLISLAIVVGATATAGGLNALFAAASAESTALATGLTT